MISKTEETSRFRPALRDGVKCGEVTALSCTKIDPAHPSGTGQQGHGPQSPTRRSYLSVGIRSRSHSQAGHTGGHRAKQWEYIVTQQEGRTVRCGPPAYPFAPLQIFLPQIVRLLLGDGAAPQVGVDGAVELAPQAVHVGDLVFLTLHVLVQRLLQTAGQVPLQVGAVLGLAVRRPRLLHCHGQKLFHGHAQCGREFAQGPGAAPCQRRLAGEDVRQRRPGNAAGLGELIAGHAFFPQELLERHMHHHF